MTLHTGDKVERVEPPSTRVLLTRTVKSCDGEMVHFEEDEIPTGAPLFMFLNGSWRKS